MYVILYPLRVFEKRLVFVSLRSFFFLNHICLATLLGLVGFD